MKTKNLVTMNGFARTIIIVLLCIAGQSNIAYAQKFTVTPFSPVSFCTTVFPTSFTTVNFSIDETAADGFDANQTDELIVIKIPSGFEFNPTVGSVSFSGADITNIFIEALSVSTLEIKISTDATANSIDAILFSNFEIRAIQSGKTGELQRDGGGFLIDGQTTNPTLSQSLGDLDTQEPLTYNSSTVTQPNTSDVGQASGNNDILQVLVNVTGGCGDQIAQFNFNTSGTPGSTNPATDISTAKVYYTGSNSVFSTGNLFGSFSGPNGAFTVTGAQSLNDGDNYFWLTYDINITATIGNDVDAQLLSFVLGSSTITDMADPDPSGQRLIAPIIFYYSRVPGNWISTGNLWSLTDGGLSCSCNPDGDGFAVISHAVTLDDIRTVDAMTIRAGGNLIGAGNALTVGGAFNTQGSGGFSMNAQMNVTSTMTLAGTGASSNSQKIVLDGDLTVGAGTSLSLTGSGSAGNLEGSYTAITNNGTLTVNGDITTIAPSPQLTNGANATLNAGGDLLPTGSLNASAVGNTVNYNGSGTQAVKLPTGGSYYNLGSANGGTRNVSAGNIDIISTLTLSGGTFNTGNAITLISTASGTARIAEITGGAAINGNVTVERYIPSTTTGWRFLSSPVQGRTLADWNDDFFTSGFPGSNLPGFSFTSIFSYDETLLGDKDFFGFIPPSSISDPINLGQSYWAYIGPVPRTIGVTGPPNTGNVSLPVSFNQSSPPEPDHDGWSFVGNPYPSAIDWNAAGWSKTNLDNAVYVWNANVSAYASYIDGASTNGGSQFIPSSQGFYVKANTFGPALSITESAKSSMAPVFFKTSGNPSTLRLSLSGNGRTDEAIVRFVPGATDGFDSDEDAYNLSNNNFNPLGFDSQAVDIATSSGSIDFSINSLPELTMDLDIPLRVTVGVSGTYTIGLQGIESMPLSSCMYLEDLLTGITIDLQTANSYTFSMSNTTNTPRFLIHITDCQNNKWVNDNGVTSGSEEMNSSLSDHIKILSTFSEGVYVQFNFNERTKTIISVYNNLGQKVMNDVIGYRTTHRIKLNLPDGSNGVYILKVQAANQLISRKIVY